ncbi:2,3-diketo-5-methylthiopentyl-1-phosphate enolase [Bacillus badius]|uniref:2,3-diketo-5-methylthiopentyl-1-phosphate enolase n=1 Tax=Bacillus badius TaxID=1455 RepID=A0ABR5ARX3_BACBA|nr:2,3-diketo-5-methylthiopentyl-1-phosphate enolase [Bacillus badius]KIL72461.1 2,3-diketo-5-methylthiopentyl-1-phosphate enolase [Bacillus badius]KIL77355.1 2,3-diketo-5-methylthiopentyl-1-phosphate enolase [Bacillus badius]KZR58020.1 2,3-diketo-5-methylthiopentyl-1-phosphate enolase [Bacillus badius]MED4718576.1 2,3-diketo-5-methylthiopentyl-1-phosphate enolase [Bacillus badius]
MGVTATYLFPAHPDQEKRAEQYALGLTVGSWTDIPHLERQQLQKNKGEVVSVEKGEKKDTVKIHYPSANFSADLPAILTTVYGKLSFFEGHELIDLTFDEELLQQFPGPRFGVEGVREQLSLYDRPLLMAIFKGVIGRDLSFFSAQLEDLLAGGIDLIKDDEILFENELTPFEKRIIAAKDIIRRHYEHTGQKALYAVNVSGRSNELHAKAERAQELGANALLFNVHAYGLDTLQALRENDNIRLPIMAHSALSGVLAGQPGGYSYSLLVGKLTRMTGGDFSLFPSPYGNVAIPSADALAIGRALTEESYFQQAFSVPSAGIHPGMVPQLLKDFGSESLVINAGGGVFGHPDGPINGAQAFRAAIHAGVRNISLPEAAEMSEPLKRAIDQWGIVTTS